MNKNKTKIGNFLVSREGTDIERIKIESVSNNWNMKVPSFNGQFKLFEYLTNNKEMHKYFDAYINIMYITANIMPDLEFIQSFIKLNDELTERLKNKVVPTEEQDKADIEAAKESYEMQIEGEAK